MKSTAPPRCTCRATIQPTCDLWSGSGGAQFLDDAKFYGTVYSPDYNVIVGNDSSNSGPSRAQVYGAIVTRRLRIGSQLSAINTAAIHFDEALLDSASGAPIVSGGGFSKAALWSQQ